MHCTILALHTLPTHLHAHPHSTGSERQRGGPSVGGPLATGHAREVSHINRSLSTLGKVIMSVAANQTGRPQHVPYRDSKLTYLLQDALGGNSKTVLLATVSPLAANMAETLTTLRFAHRAKSIVNSAVVNTAPAGMVLRVPSGKGAAVTAAEVLEMKQHAALEEDATRYVCGCGAACIAFCCGCTVPLTTHLPPPPQWHQTKPTA